MTKKQQHKKQKQKIKKQQQKTKNKNKNKQQQQKTNKQTKPTLMIKNGDIDTFTENCHLVGVMVVSRRFYGWEIGSDKTISDHDIDDDDLKTVMP